MMEAAPSPSRAAFLPLSSHTPLKEPPCTPGPFLLRV